MRPLGTVPLPDWLLRRVPETELRSSRLIERELPWFGLTLMLAASEINMNLRLRELEESRLLAGRSPEIKAEQSPKMTSSPMDRIRAKALQARGIMPAAIKEFETELDGIISQEEVIRQKQVAALAPHKEAMQGLSAQFDELKAAMDLMSNGGPPLNDPLPASAKPADGS